MWEILEEEEDLSHHVPMETKIPPPATFNDWLVANDLDDWPLEIEEEPDPDSKTYLRPLEFVGVGSKDDIRDEIKKKASFQIGILDELLNQVLAVEEKVTDYASYFFGEAKKESSSVAHTNEKCRAATDIVLDQDVQRHEKIKEIFSFKRKDFEHAVFPGYFDYEVTPLPGSLEAPPLLNHVTRFKDFNTCFRKIWQRYFLSEASVAIMQDAFWWVFLDHKEQKNPKSQSKLFNRLASSFVYLFLTISNTDKDLFFKYYPDCLSQAIYAGFCAAFEASSSKFNEQFRRDLVVLVYEWITGTQPHVEEILKHWPLEALESKTTQDSADDKAYVLKASLSFDENTFLDTSPRKMSLGDEVGGLNSFSSKQTKDSSQSHPVGPGPTYDKLSFNIYGRSPFITHYLSSKNLKREEELLRKIVTRTQFNEKDRKPQETYEELIAKHKENNSIRDVNYKHATSQISKECQNLKKQKRKDIKAMHKLQGELLTRHLDIKILSQKIMDRMNTSSFAARKVSAEMTEDHKEGKE